MLDVCLLGCGGMLPLPKRFLTSLLIRHQGSNLLIDCGEGNQVALYLSDFSFKAIDYILITHFHGDHVAGLPGLFMTIGNNMRTKPLHVYGGKGLKEILAGLMVICPQLPFEVVVHELPFDEASEFAVGDLVIQGLPVEHRVPCLAYSVSLPRKGKFAADKAKALGLPVEYWRILQNGQDVVYGGETITPTQVMGQPRKGLKITYSTDCRPSAALVELAKDSDLLIGEGLYGDESKQGSAAAKGHMIFSEAAHVAKAAGAKELWLTHYSPAMQDMEEFLPKTREIFADTYLGENLKTKTLRFTEA